jgi:hypothetical protein
LLRSALLSSAVMTISRRGGMGVWYTHAAG